MCLYFYKTPFYFFSNVIYSKIEKFELCGTAYALVFVAQDRV